MASRNFRSRQIVEEGRSHAVEQDEVGGAENVTERHESNLGRNRSRDETLIRQRTCRPTATPLKAAGEPVYFQDSTE